MKTSEFETTLLHWMRILDSTEEVADCHLWTGATTGQGYPQYKPFGKCCALVRRAAFELNGGTLKDRMPIVTTCGEKLCINPKHLAESTPSKVGQKAAKNGAWKGLARSSKIASAKRAKNAKLTIDQAREIRQSTEPTKTIAQRLGVNPSVINGIKAGTRWRDYSNPYLGLMK